MQTRRRRSVTSAPQICEISQIPIRLSQFLARADRSPYSNFFAVCAQYPARATMGDVYPRAGAMNRICLIDFPTYFSGRTPVVEPYLISLEKLVRLKDLGHRFLDFALVANLIRCFLHVKID
jgi:hypothetical protein